MCLIKVKNIAGLQAGFVPCSTCCTVFIWHSLLFSIFWSCNQLRVYGVSSHIFNAFKCLKFLYGCIILLNILWHCNPQLRLLKLGFSVLQCGLYILKFYEWICFRVVVVFWLTMTQEHFAFQLHEIIQNTKSLKINLIIWALK